MALTTEISTLIPIIRGLVRDLQQTDGRDFYTYTSDNKFSISEYYIDSSSIVITVNGITLGSSDWSFDENTRQVTIDYEDSGSELSEDDEIEIFYSYYKKYSDTQIQAYINSALSYFVEYRYNKTFFINSDDEIDVENGEVATTEELNFICGITSILIDPQNVTVDTPEFKLGRNREMSDQQQIRLAFKSFQKFAGEVSFNIIDPNC